MWTGRNAAVNCRVARSRLGLLTRDCAVEVPTGVVEQTLEVCVGQRLSRGATHHLPAVR